MSNPLALLNQQAPALAGVFAGRGKGEELSGGIGPSFAVASIRGKTWRIKFQGQEHGIYLPADPANGIPGQTIPKPYIDVVIVRASPAISKNYYPNGYVQGSDDAPVCFSTDGVKPDEGSQVKQANACATCTHNVWGSKITPDGKKVKACQDLKRLAIVPASDIDNQMFGGPMLLRVPPGSLKNMDAFNQALQSQGVPYFAVRTRISFDPAAEYPLLNFEATAYLSDAEGARVLALQDGALVKRILSEEVVAAIGEPQRQIGAPAQAAQPTIVQPGQPVVAPPVTAPPVTVAPVPVAPVVAPVPPAPVVAPVTTTVAPPVPTTVAPVATTMAPPAPTTVAPPVAAPVVAAPMTDPPPPAAPDQSALMAALAAAGVTINPDGTVTTAAPAPKKRTRNPSPQPTVAEPTVIEGQAVQVAPPVAAPPVAAPPAPSPVPVAPVATPVAETPLTAQPGAGAAATAGIAAKLSSML